MTEIDWTWILAFVIAPMVALAGGYAAMRFNEASLQRRKAPRR